MELTIFEQIFDQVKKAGKVLVVLPQVLTADSLSSGLALRRFLLKQQKDVTLVSNGVIPENLKFLPEVESIKNEITAGKSLVVKLDTTVKKLEEISYETSDSSVQIFLKSKTEPFTPQDLSFNQEKFPIDLIVTLEAASLETLGKIYENNTDLFFETPKINIDNKATNEYFAAINLVDITATSVAEILTGLLQQYEQQLIDEDLATCLLAGIISKTQSFQHVQTTPKAFLKASELVALGGRQQEIVKNIYKTKSLPLLKLWGRALARMKTQEQAKTVYSLLNFTDFERSEATAEQLTLVLKEFLDNISGFNIVALITEPVKGLHSITAAVHEQVVAEKFLAVLGLGGFVSELSFGNYKIVEVSGLPDSLEVLETKFLESLNKIS